MRERINTFLGSLSSKVGILILGGVLALGLAVALAFVLLGRAQSFTRLDADHPSATHPDGLTIELAEGVDSLKVQIDSLPRETFLSGEDKKWQEAYEALPEFLTSLSPLYTVQTRGDGRVVARMSVPNGAEPLALLDLYRWDQAEAAWVFLPSHVDQEQQTIIFEPEALPVSVMAVHTEPQSPSIGAVISEGGSDLAPEYGFVMLEGVYLTAEGSFMGEPVAGGGSTTLVRVENRLGGLTDYTNTEQLSPVVDYLVTLAAPYDGLVLDFDPGSGYTDFVAVLAERIHAHAKRIDVVLDDRVAEYDPAGLARHVDQIWYAPGNNPIAYLPHQSVQETLDQLVGQVDRNHLGLLVGGLTVDVSANGDVNPVGSEAALARFGEVEPVSGYIDADKPLLPGSSVPFHLTGQIDSMGYDASLRLNYLTYHDEGGQLHHVYFGSAQNLQQKLSWVHYYGLKSAMIYGLAHPDAPSHLADGVSAFLTQQQLSPPADMTITWQVKTASGASLSEESGDLAFIQYLWQAATDPGTYIVSAAVNGPDGADQRGQVGVLVGEGEAQPGSDSTTPTATPDSEFSSEPAQTSDEPTEPPPAPTQAPVTGSVAPGSFELGGQTHTLEHPEEMRYAGMNWVKFQHKWGPGNDPAGTVGGRIQQAHSLGLKVLLSIPGSEHPSSIDYEAYVNYLSGVAALGPDAIEVWNEMNLDREWIYGDINGANYVTNMLAPAYQAIKAANPDVMVISGAPAPTGYWGGCSPEGCDDWVYISQMRDAGANNYMDCVGIHFNSGATSPAASTGHPAGDHYTWYYGGMVDLYYGTFGKPLCFTELGYISGEGLGPLPSNWSWASDVTVAQQAQWLAESAVLSSQSGKVRLMIIFNVDFTVYGADPQAGYAIIRPGGGCPACDALNAVMP